MCRFHHPVCLGLLVTTKRTGGRGWGCRGSLFREAAAAAATTTSAGTATTTVGLFLCAMGLHALPCIRRDPPPPPPPHFPQKRDTPLFIEHSQLARSAPEFMSTCMCRSLLCAQGVIALQTLSCIRGDSSLPPISPERLHDAVNILLSYQNRDGGWATYENTRGFRW